MITNTELCELKIGEKVRYAMYRNIKYNGIDDGHVLLEDGNGNERKVRISLFLKHGSKT